MQNTLFTEGYVVTSQVHWKLFLLTSKDWTEASQQFVYFLQSSLTVDIHFFVGQQY